MSADTAEKDATVAALVTALERKSKRLPVIPIGSRVRVRRMGVGTVVGADGVGFEGLAVIFDDPPSGFEEGCCAGVEECEVLSTPTCPIPPEVPARHVDTSTSERI